MKKLTKILCSFVLILALLISCMSVAFAEAPLQLTVASDIHFAGNDVTGPLTESDGTLYPHATIQGQLNYESEAILNAFLKDFLASDSPILLLPGDLTGGNRLSHTQLAEKLTAVQKAGKQVFVITGNHDIRAERNDKNIDVNEFKEIYHDFGYDKAVSVDSGSASYAVDLDSTHRLLAIDSCIYGKDDGHITKAVYDWIDEQVQASRRDGKEIIAMMHHSLLPHLIVQPNAVHNEATKGGTDALVKQFGKWGIQVVFTGHIHANDISSADAEGKTVYDIQTGSLIVSPNAYREVTFSGSKVNIQSRYITSIDATDLPGGFSDEQLALIRSDFAAYSYNFFEEGIGKWIDKYIGSAHKVGKMLKLDPDSAIYAVLDDIMSVLGDALRLPLYGENSVESLAKKAGVTLPQSDYTKVSQVAAKLMHAFYRGDEAFTKDSPEVQLLLAALYGGIAYAVGAYATGAPFLQKVYNAFGLRAKITNNTAKILFSRSVAKKFIGKVIMPLVNGVIRDAYAPADIHTTLTLQEPVYGGVVLNIWLRIRNYILAILGIALY